MQKEGRCQNAWFHLCPQWNSAVESLGRKKPSQTAAGAGPRRLYQGAGPILAKCVFTVKDSPTATLQRNRLEFRTRTMNEMTGELPFFSVSVEFHQFNKSIQHSVMDRIVFLSLAYGTSRLCLDLSTRRRPNQPIVALRLERTRYKTATQIIRMQITLFSITSQASF